eukprot:6187958-Pleurochrysis_carterae.AAC.2
MLRLQPTVAPLHLGRLCLEWQTSACALATMARAAGAPWHLLEAVEWPPRPGLVRTGSSLAQVIVFNNRRMLHGRTAIQLPDQGDASRWLQGCRAAASCGLHSAHVFHMPRRIHGSRAHSCYLTKCRENQQVCHTGRLGHASARNISKDHRPVHTPTVLLQMLCQHRRVFQHVQQAVPRTRYKYM